VKVGKLFLQLTKLRQSDTIELLHKKPPVLRFEFGGAYSYRFTGGFLFFIAGGTYENIFFYVTL
jgi:hypothetical protein